MRDNRLILAKLILRLRRRATVISKFLPITVDHPTIRIDVAIVLTNRFCGQFFRAVEVAKFLANAPSHVELDASNTMVDATRRVIHCAGTSVSDKFGPALAPAICHDRPTTPLPLPLYLYLHHYYHHDIEYHRYLHRAHIHFPRCPLALISFLPLPARRSASVHHPHSRP
jgi:hypothetical protein